MNQDENVNVKSNEKNEKIKTVSITPVTTGAMQSPPLTFDDVEEKRRLSISIATLKDFPSEGQSRSFHFIESPSGDIENMVQTGGNPVTNILDFVRSAVCNEDGSPAYTETDIRRIPLTIIHAMADAMAAITTEKVEQAKNT